MFRVAKGSTVANSKFERLPEGTIINPQDQRADGKPEFSKEWIDEQLRNGVIEHAIVNSSGKPLTLEPARPGQDRFNTMPHESFSNQDAPKGVVLTSSNPNTPRVSAAPPPAPRRGAMPIRMQQSPWILDPSLLQDKDLPALQVMIRERDGAYNPLPGTVAEAIGVLSRDFGKHT